MNMRVAVIGASDKPDRYSYQAVELLQKKGHDVYAVHPRVKKINDLPVYPSIKDVPEEIDTITLYINSAASEKIKDDIIACRPRRIIFNPGTENPQLEELASQSGIATEQACTLVMLRTGQF